MDLFRTYRIEGSEDFVKVVRLADGHTINVTAALTRLGQNDEWVAPPEAAVKRHHSDPGCLWIEEELAPEACYVPGSHGHNLD